jgi:hypothetical protein
MSSLLLPKMTFYMRMTDFAFFFSFFHKLFPSFPSAARFYKANQRMFIFLLALSVLLLCKVYVMEGSEHFPPLCPAEVSISGQEHMDHSVLTQHPQLCAILGFKRNSVKETIFLALVICWMLKKKLKYNITRYVFLHSLSSEKSTL